jgi:hypothetical protein
MALIPQFQITSISTNTTTSLAAGGIMIHTIVAPIAAGGTITLTDYAGSPATYLILPIGTIGTMLLDAVFPNGVKVVTSASDKVLVTWQSL